MAEQKTFINGVWIREHQFQNGGSILKVSIPLDKVDAFAEQLKFNARADGWVRLQIAANKQPTMNAQGKVSSTHSLSVDTWEPQQQTAPRQQQPRPAAHAPAQDDSDVPF